MFSLISVCSNRNRSALERKLLSDNSLFFLLPSAWIMHRISHSSVQGACCLDIGFRHMFSALDCVAFGWCIRHAVKFSPCVLLTLAQGSGRL